MDLNSDTIYQNFSSIFKAGVIDLGNVTFFNPWAIGLICLKAIENGNNPDKNLILPRDPDIIKYLKRMHFDEIMAELTYGSFLDKLKNADMNERENLNIHEILHCLFRDQFTARLGSGIRRMFINFGMSEADEQRATALLGELGNNVFDHNEGAWPTKFRGAIIVAQNYPKIQKIEVVVADPGVGFAGSLKNIENPPKNDSEAIKLGLQGVTGRIGEPRGNGLKLVQDWTINKFNGIIMIHSGNALIEVSRDGVKEKSVPKILGTLAEFVVLYK